MYITSTKFSSSKRYRDCKVYHINSIKSFPHDLTNQVAKRFDLKYINDKIRIYHGSGNGAMVLKQLLEQFNTDPMNHSLKVFVIDVSV